MTSLKRSASALTVLQPDLPRSSEGRASEGRAGELTRRSLLELALAFVAGRSLVACGSGDGRAAPQVETPDLPTLGGAPDTPEGRTVAAFVDTIIPGRHRDPEDAVGGIDVGAPALFFDPALPAGAFVPILVLLLDSLSDERFQRPFAALLPSQREVIVERGLEAADELEFAVQFARLAYCASDALGAHLGYPGPNPGYVGDADFSFGVPVARPMTVAGNLP